MMKIYLMLMLMSSLLLVIRLNAVPNRASKTLPQ
jgi:hypothetical protein